MTATTIKTQAPTAFNGHQNNRTSARLSVFQTCLVDVCHLVAIADRTINSKERELSSKMCELEEIKKEAFDERVINISMKSSNLHLEHVICELRTLSRQQQVRVLAWGTLIANSDGFMSTNEFALVYKLYHTELKLDQHEVLDEQRKIQKSFYGANTGSTTLHNISCESTES